MNKTVIYQPVTTYDDQSQIWTLKLWRHIATDLLHSQYGSNLLKFMNMFYSLNTFSTVVKITSWYRFPFLKVPLSPPPPCPLKTEYRSKISAARYNPPIGNTMYKTGPYIHPIIKAVSRRIMIKPRRAYS